MPTTLNKKYMLGRQLGQGASCKVRLAKEQEGGQRYAAKIFKRDIHIDEILSTELKTMAKLRHPGILNLVDQGTGLQENPKKGSKEVTYIILELAEGGELFDIVAFCGPYAESLARYQGKQFLQTLKFMHDQGVCHRDLKPENLLLDSKFDIKIADFGFAASTEGRDGSGKLRTKVGTLDYMAPEIHLGQPYDGKSDDLFAAGIILFMMLTARPPFRTAQKEDPYYKLLIGKRADLFWQAQAAADDNGKDIYSPEFKNLFEKMCAFNPKDRLTLEQVLAHPWFSGPVMSSDNVLKELKARKASIDAQARQDQESKRSKRKDRAEVKKPSRGDGVEEDPEELMKLAAWKQLEVPTFDDYCMESSMTRFFTTAEPVETFKALVEAIGVLAKEGNGTVQVSEDKLKIKYKLNHKTEYEADEESKEGATEENEPIDVSATVCRVNDHKLCVDFVLKEGSRDAFIDHFKQLIDQESDAVLSIYNNATQDE